VANGRRVRAAICLAALALGCWVLSAKAVSVPLPDGARARAAEQAGPPSPWEPSGTANIVRPPVRAAAETTVSSEGDPSFLDAIGIPAAWKELDRDVTGTIAVVDTGVDLKLPMLAPYLTDGVNLLDRSKPPQDDNGHGTAVAGILAAIAEAAKANAQGASWKMKIMPIKALDRSGEGTEANLAAGIRYALDHRADIVVLSLGLRRDSPELRQVVAAAERQGVLLVAAVGNDTAEFGDKAAVQYPAAYATVLAVGGADGAQADRRSTPGPEVDVAAPWRVRTLKPGGGTVSMEGSSMSAAQAAGAAALLRAAEPGASPARLRDTLRRTTQDIAAQGWDPATGYGLIRTDRAVAAADNADWREPNDDRSRASVLPLGAEVLGTWATEKDRDDYRIDVPYDGALTISWQRLDAEGKAADAGAEPDLRLFAAGSAKETPVAGSTLSSRTWQVAAGRYELQTGGGAGADGIGYRLQSRFAMAPDAMEPDQTALTAHTLAPRTQQWTGSFHEQGDEDWFAVTLPKAGKLRLRVDPGTTRIDPAVSIGKAGKEVAETDANGYGESEEIVIPEASAGKYYIRIRNAVSSYPAAVVGTYTARLEYIVPYEDPNEPNDGPLAATPLAGNADAPREGLFDAKTDADWFRFALDKPHLVRLQLTNLPSSVRATMTLYDQRLAEIGRWRNAAGEDSVAFDGRLDAGTYYVKLTADAPFRRSFYEQVLRQSAEESRSFRDIAGHWAEPQIRAVANAGWIVGDGAGSFHPHRGVTRAEAVVMAVRARSPAPSAVRTAYPDVPPSYWAYDAIAKAGSARWLAGIGGWRFEPERALTRGEAALLLARAAQLPEPSYPKLRFADVPLASRAAGAVDALVQKGWVNGYADGTFRPNRPISRAEWAAMLANLLPNA